MPQFESFSTTYDGSDKIDGKTYIAEVRTLGLYILTRSVGVLTGSVFSKIAADLVQSFIEKAIKKQSCDSLSTVSNILRSSLVNAHDQLREKLLSKNKEASDLAGVSIEVLWIYDGQILIGHIGTCRVYLFRTGKLYQLTKDQSYASAMVQDSFMSEKQAQNMPFGDRIANALGFNAKQIPITISAPTLNDGDAFLLASSRLHRKMSPNELVRLFSKKPPNPVDSALVINCKMAEEPNTKPIINPVTALQKIQDSFTFRSLDYKDLLALQEIAIERTYLPGTTIIKQGDIANSMWIGISGKLEVFYVDTQGQNLEETQIAIRDAIGPFGEASLYYEQGIRSATVKAFTDVIALEFDRNKILALIGNDNSPGVLIYRSMAIQEHYRTDALTKELAAKKKKAK